MRYLIIQAGKYVDKNEGKKAFPGIVPRDLAVGDRFEKIYDGIHRVMEIIERTELEDGGVSINSREVIG